MTYTKEALLNAFSRAKHFGNTKGIITKEEARLRAAKLGYVNFAAEMLYDEKQERSIGVGFFLDDYCFGVGILPNRFVPGSTTLPLRITPRQEFPDGRIRNVDEYLAFFHKGQQLIESVDELVEYLNTREAEQTTPS